MSRSIDKEVSWWDYAAAYDLLCHYNYHYQALLVAFREWLIENNPDLSAKLAVCELGAGTGNFLIEAISTMPALEITHWDWNSEMVLRASSKYAALGINPKIEQTNILELHKNEKKFDLIVAINALYSFPEPLDVIEKAANKLNPGGYLYIVDVGRPINTFAWTRDLFTHAMKKEGLFRSLGLLVRLRKAIIENRKIDKSADLGEYWRHELHDLVEGVEATGLNITIADTCYRGIADRVVAKLQL